MTTSKNVFELEWFRKKTKTPFDRLINVLDKGPLPFTVIVINQDDGHKAIMSRMGQPSKDDFPTYSIIVSLKEDTDKKSLTVTVRTLCPGDLMPTLFSCEKLPELYTDENKAFDKIKESLAGAEDKLKTLKKELEQKCPAV
jgi:hypothetical protein